MKTYRLYFREGLELDVRASRVLLDQDRREVRFADETGKFIDDIIIVTSELQAVIPLEHLVESRWPEFDDGGEPAHDGSEGAVQLSVSEALRVPNEDAIRDALRNLLNRTEAQAFVILLDARTGNYVQFIGSKARPLQLDLPFSALSENARGRAAEYFRREGILDAESEESFSIPLRQNVERGARLALGIFEEVYRADPDFSLKIEEN